MILLTGCNTNLGRKTLNELLAKGEKVRCMDFYKPKDLPEDVEFIHGNLLDNIILKKACTGVETVFHFMDVKSPAFKGRKFMKKNNIRGTQNIVFAAKKAGVKRFFFLSSFAVYGKSKKLPQRPDDAKKPYSRYGKDKLKAEILCQRFTKKGNMALTIFRPALTLSADSRDPTMLIMLYMALGMNDENRLYIVGNGDTFFQLLDPDEAVKGFISAYDTQVSRGKIYNFGSDNVLTQMEQIVKIKELAKLNVALKHLSVFKAKLMSVMLKPMRSNFLTKDHLNYLMINALMDCQLAKDELDWCPEKDNLQIMSGIINWYKKEKV